MTSILASKAVLAALSMSRWNGHRIDRNVTDKVNRQHHAATDAGRYNKKLISTEQMAPVLACVTKARNYHYKMTQPWLDEGARILPSKLFLEYTEEMRDIRVEFDAAAREFIKLFPSYVKDARSRLGNLFDADDYPSQVELETMFAFDVAILPCPNTDDFRIAVGEEHVEDIRLDLEKRIRSTMMNATRDKMACVAEVIGNMASKLRSYDPGDEETRASGTFRDSLVENVREMARLLPSFNLTDDAGITKIQRRIQKDLCQLDATELRNNPEVRDKTAQSAEEILGAMQDFIA